MIAEETKNLIQEQFNRLPKALQEAILSVPLREKFGAVQKKSSLHIDESAVVENETMMALLGFKELDRFEENLMDELQVPAEKAREIAMAVNEEVFLPIQEAMRRQLSRATPEETRLKPVTAPVEVPQTPKAEEEANLQKEGLLQEGNPALSKDFVPDNLPTHEEMLLEIENPKPDELLSPGKTASVIMPKGSENAIPQTPPASPPPLPPREVPQVFKSAPEESAKNLVKHKLSETLRVPHEKIDLSANTPRPTPAPAPSIDPYREPIE